MMDKINTKTSSLPTETANPLFLFATEKKDTASPTFPLPVKGTVNSQIKQATKTAITGVINGKYVQQTANSLMKLYDKASIREALKEDIEHGNSVTNVTVSLRVGNGSAEFLTKDEKEIAAKQKAAQAILKWIK